MSEKDDSVITLTGEDGKEYDFILLGFTEYEDKLYAVFMPEESKDEEEISLIVMEAREEKDEVSFEILEDEDIGNAVLDKFMKEEEEDEK